MLATTMYLPAWGAPEVLGQPGERAGMRPERPAGMLGASATSLRSRSRKAVSKRW